MHARSQHGGAAIAILALLASFGGLALGGAALYMVMDVEKRIIPSPGLDAYDLSTPEKAVEATLKMEADFDYASRYKLQLMDEKRSDLYEKVLDTLDIDDTEDYKDYILVYYSYKTETHKEYETTWLTKVDDIYIRVSISLFDDEDLDRIGFDPDDKDDQEDIKELKEDMRKWRDRRRKLDDD